MSFVTTHPEALAAAASDLQGIGSAMTAQNAAAATPITGLAPAAADEVSTLQATQFSAYGTLYEQISAQAAALQDMFVNTLRGSADSYGATEAANSAAAGTAGAGLAGLTGPAGTAGAGLAGLTGTTAAADPSSGLAALASNTGILAAMQGGTVGSASSEFTGLGKGYITNPAGVTHAGTGAPQAGLVSETAPASPAAAAAVPVSASAGQSSSVGKLSVPPSWAGEVAATSAAPRATLTGASLTAAGPHAAAATTMPAGLPAMASANRGGYGFGRPRYGVKPIVMPRRPVV